MFEIALARGLDQVVEVFEHQQLERLLRAAAGLDDPLQALALLGEDLVLAAGLGFELGEDGGRLAFGLDAAFLGLGLGVDDDAGLLGLGRGFDCGAALGLDALGLGQRGLGHGAVLGFEHRRLGLALARLRRARTPRPSSPASSACEAATSACDVFSPSIALAFGLGHRDAHLPLGVLHLRLSLERGRLLADLLLLVELGDAAPPARAPPRGCRSRVASCALATWIDFSRSASATRISPIFSLSATSPRACWIAWRAAFWPMASM